MQSEELAWLEYYKKAGISWLAPMTVELIKLAYFAGMKAAQQQRWSKSERQVKTLQNKPADHVQYKQGDTRK